MRASRILLLAAVALASAASLAPSASAVGVCEAGVCVSAETYSPPISFQYCLDYGASYGSVGHAGTACTQEPLCTNPWFCLQRLPRLNAPDTLADLAI